MYDMSPGREWESTISPPAAGAVNVFMKKDSPESERLRPFRIPPCVQVSIRVPVVMLSIAPPSQRICSPPPSWPRRR